MSSLAQEESRSISENVRWGLRKKAADGKFSLNYSYFLGYDKGPNGKLVVNKEQAAVVRRIYGEFLAGKSACQIAKELTEDGNPDPGGEGEMESRDGAEHFVERKILRRHAAPEDLRGRLSDTQDGEEHGPASPVLC